MRAAVSRASSKSATPLPTSAPSRRSTPACTRSISAPLFPALRSIASDNAQGEYYLPDLVGIYRRRDLVVETVSVADVREIQGINSRAELAAWGSRETAEERPTDGGRGDARRPGHDVCRDTVVIGPDTVLHPNVYLEGRTRIGAGCVVHAGSRIVGLHVSAIESSSRTTRSSRARSSAEAQIGPFAHVRPDSEVLEGAHIGNFVELKKTVMGARREGGASRVSRRRAHRRRASTSAPAPSRATTTARASTRP